MYVKILKEMILFFLIFFWEKSFEVLVMAFTDTNNNSAWDLSKQEGRLAPGSLVKNPPVFHIVCLFMEENK